MGTRRKVRRVTKPKRTGLYDAHVAAGAKIVRVPTVDALAHNALRAEPPPTYVAVVLDVLEDIEEAGGGKRPRPDAVGLDQRGDRLGAHPGHPRGPEDGAARPGDRLRIRLHDGRIAEDERGR